MVNGTPQVPEVIRNYKTWVALTQIGYWEMAQMRNEVSGMAYQPRVSILVPVYNTLYPWLEKALDSVLSQTYPYWELCICDDASTEDHVRETLDLYERLDERVKVKRLSENAGISEATNQALSLASGEFVGLLDHDDELAPNALFEVVKFLQERPDADLVYSDEDKIDEDGKRMGPHIKIGWSPDLALGCNYLNHFSVYRRSVLEKAGGWRVGFEGAQDFDLVQRFSEKTDRIHHLPKVLYHWRQTEGSTALGSESKPYTHERARRAVEDSLSRRGIAGSAWDGPAANMVRVEREIAGEPLVSVVIPFTGETPQTCLDNLKRRTSYPNYEVAVVDVESGLMTGDPGSTEQVTRQLEHSNLSELCNAAVRQTSGEYVLILDQGFEEISERWLENLLQHAQRPEVGAVGGKITLPSDVLFQAGLILDGEERSKGTDGGPHFHRPCDRRAVGHPYVWNLPRNSSAVSSECMMFPRSVFEEAGGFDAARLGAEFADVDLCLRMQERGYSIVYTPYAEFAYRGAPPKPAGLSPEEADYVRRRWGHVLGADPYYNPNLAWAPDDPLRNGNKPVTPEPKKQRAAAFNSHRGTVSLAGTRGQPSPPTQISEASEGREPPVTSSPPVASTQLEAVDAAPPFFVVGHGRSGTTWLEKSLNSHPEVLCKGSGMFFGRDPNLFRGRYSVLYRALAESEGLRAWHEARENCWSDRPYEEELPGMLKAFIDHILGTELARSGKKIAGDRTPHYVTHLEEVREIYPDSKVIHIIRDGRDVAVSNLHAFWHNAQDKGGAARLGPEEMELRDAYIEDRKKFISEDRSIFSETRIKQLSGGWNRVVSKGRRDGGELFGENYIETRYEDLLEAPGPELGRLFEFLGVDRTPGVVERVAEETRFENMSGRPAGEEDTTSFFRKGVAGDWKEIFTKRDRQIFEKEAGELLVELGYEGGQE